MQVCMSASCRHRIVHGLPTSTGYADCVTFTASNNVEMRTLGYVLILCQGQ